MLGRAVIKDADEIKLMRLVCQITAKILDQVGSIIRPGISTEEINHFIHSATLESGAIPSTLNYKGYPKSCCVSVNEVVCHGIPDRYTILKAGDIVNVDATSYKYGFHGDSSRMYFVGGRDACSAAAQNLVDHTKEALMRGIAEVAPGKKIGDIGSAIQEYIRSLNKNYGIVRDFTGHGVGRDFHEWPQVPHFGRRGIGELLRPGMTFTIEPMINIGTHKTVLSKIDGWTVRTADNALSAQWEHTVLVTEKGCELLTDSSLF